YDLENLKLDQGRFFSESESVSGAPVAVIGYEVAQNLFKNTNPLGKRVRLYGNKFTIIGVISAVVLDLLLSPYIFLTKFTGINALSSLGAPKSRPDPCLLITPMIVNLLPYRRTLLPNGLVFLNKFCATS
ncbi:ABC transporter permease, partial [Nonlabens mediterrranea]|nr:ABC transporter permease [Nonlabens mediterrranea]